MKILAVGDFQGVFPEKLKKRIKKEEFDLIVGVGDYAGLEVWRPFIMKQLALAKKGINISSEEYFGKKRYNVLLKRDFNAGKKVLSELNKLGKKAIIVFGNTDWYRYPFEKWKRQKGYDGLVKKLKNLENITYGKTKYNGINFIGSGGYMDIDAYMNKKEWKEDDEKTSKKRLMRREKGKKKLFGNIGKTKGERVFVFHYPPQGVFDIIKGGKDNPMNGKSAGIGFFSEAIKKHKPRLVLCGHMHEYRGMKKIYGVPIVNPGDAEKGKAAIIDVPEGKGNVKIKLID